MQTEISWFFMKSPELAGIRARTLSLQAVDWISAVVLGPLSLPAKSRFPMAEADQSACREPMPTHIGTGHSVYGPTGDRYFLASSKCRACPMTDLEIEEAA